jgi:hypothetical protein
LQVLRLFFGELRFAFRDRRDLSVSSDFLKSLSSNRNATAADVEAEFFAKHRSTLLLQRLINPEEIAGSLRMWKARLRRQQTVRLARG